MKIVLNANEPFLCNREWGLTKRQRKYGLDSIYTCEAFVFMRTFIVTLFVEMRKMTSIVDVSLDDRLKRHEFLRSLQKHIQVGTLFWYNANAKTMYIHERCFCIFICQRLQKVASFEPSYGLKNCKMTS